MSEFNTGIPNIRVVIREARDETAFIDVPSLVVKVERSPDYNVNVIPSTQVVLRTGSFFNIADLALNAVSSSYALTASYAHTINRQISGSVFITGSTTITDNLTVEGIISAEQLIVSSSIIYESGSTKFGDSPDDTQQNTGSVLVQGPLSTSEAITGSVVKSNEFRLNAGTVHITFTGSINTGIFGVTEDVRPYISTTEYAGTTIDYIAQRPEATRIGMVMATWSGSNVVFTDISTADIGDTKDISFGFVQSGSYFKLRVNSNGSGSGLWTVQSLFKLFPNLNP